MLSTKNTAARIAVLRDRNVVAPREPNTVPDAPEPKPEPAAPDSKDPPKPAEAAKPTAEMVDADSVKVKLDAELAIQRSELLGELPESSFDEAVVAIEDGS